ncbi:MAG: NUDIX domain-containing protein [Patescibacteria group bacterium]
MSSNKLQIAEGERARLEVSAGALVYKRVKDEVCFAMIKDPYGKWTFPKGHVRRGETLQEAATRECTEETGLRDLHFRRKLGTIDIWFRDRFVFKGRLIHKYIHYYLLEASPLARVHLPKHLEGEKIQEVAWVSIQELTKRSGYKDMKEIVRRALQIVGNGR